MCVYFFEKMWKEVGTRHIIYDRIVYIHMISIRYRHMHTLKKVFKKNYIRMTFWYLITFGINYTSINYVKSRGGFSLLLIGFVNIMNNLYHQNQWMTIQHLPLHFPAFSRIMFKSLNSSSGFSKLTVGGITPFCKAKTEKIAWLHLQHLINAQLHLSWMILTTMIIIFISNLFVI